MSSLKVFGISGNKLQKQAGVIIGRAMRLRNGLPGLHCADNKLGDHGAAAIGGALAGKVSISWSDLLPTCVTNNPLLLISD